MTPQTINAYYNAGFNEIVFPARSFSRRSSIPNATTRPTLVHRRGDRTRDRHGFDDQGSKVDGTGRLRDWWSPRIAPPSKSARERSLISTTRSRRASRQSCE